MASNGLLDYLYFWRLKDGLNLSQHPMSGVFGFKIMWAQLVILLKLRLFLYWPAIRGSLEYNMPHVFSSFTFREWVHYTCNKIYMLWHNVYFNFHDTIWNLWPRMPSDCSRLFLEYLWRPKWRRATWRRGICKVSWRVLDGFSFLIVTNKLLGNVLGINCPVWKASCRVLVDEMKSPELAKGHFFTWQPVN